MMYNRSGSGSMRNMSRPCPHCMKEHGVGQRCEVACAYCHSFHLSTELIQGVCPNMQVFAMTQRPKNKLTCKGCQGEGMLEKAIDITYLELQSKWQKRVILFKSKPQNNERESPSRKVVRVQHKLQTFQCKQCEGTGYINKVIYCCRYGCEKCNSQRCFINPVWLKYKTQDYAATCNGIFSCSQCRRRIQMGETYFSLPCDHLYHNECFIQNCWECLVCEYAEDEKERMEAIKKMEEKLELQVSDIVSNDQEASDIDNLKEEIINLSFAARRKSEEQVLMDPRALYTYMLRDSYIPKIDLDQS